MDGYMRKVEFNGKELMKAGFEKNGKQIKQTVEMPCGHKMDTTLTWETDNFMNNKAKMTFDGPDTQNHEAEFEWDMQPNSKNLKVKAHGENEMMGKFQVNRDYMFENKNGEQHMTVKGMTNLPNSPLPSNLETEMEAIYANPTTYNFGSYVLMAGDKMGWEYNSKDGFKWHF